MKKIIEKFGGVNVLISIICCIFFLLNSVLITKTALLNINDNIAVAYVFNFLAGCEGILGKWGSMSYVMCFEELQLWRVLTHIYLHAGVIHMAMNLAALLVVGKYVEKRLGTAVYITVFHLIAIVDAIIVSFLYTVNESVGASAGIFGIMGIAFVMHLKKQMKLKKLEVVYLIIFIMLSSVLGMESFVLHMLALVLGIIYGFVVIRNNNEIGNK